MDMLLVCSEASAASLTANVLWATEARKSGLDVAVMFTAEALAALAKGTFLWSRELSHQSARLAMADSGKAKGLPIMMRGEARQLDILGLLQSAQAAGVPMYADPIWIDLLALRGQLPAGVEALDLPGGLKILSSAKTVVGSL